MKTKHLYLTIALLSFASFLRAQDCEAIMLPYFNNDIQRLRAYPEPKLAVRCAMARLSFDVADSLPANAPLHSITEVHNRFTDEPLSESFVVDLNTLSYHGFNFDHFRGLHPDQTVYFSTPASDHPYLILRSFNDAAALAYEWEKKNIQW